MKLICDQCMKNAEVTPLRERNWYYIQCHGVERLWLTPVDMNINIVQVWSNVEKGFSALEDLNYHASSHRDSIMKCIKFLSIVERVRLTMDGASIWALKLEELDEVIDALIHMRGQNVG